MLNETEHLLVMLNEEAVEVAKECDKAVRFGLDDVYKDEPQHRRLAREITHFITTLERLRDQLPALIDYEIIYTSSVGPTTDGEKDMAERKARMEHYMEYARKVGHLEKNE
jgi:hypothetical protein